MQIIGRKEFLGLYSQTRVLETDLLFWFRFLNFHVTNEKDSKINSNFFISLII